MNTKSIAVVGAMGYGKGIIDEVIKNGYKYNSELCAIIDVSPNAKEEFSHLLAGGIKCYKTLDEMYENMSVDLVLISSPIQFHSIQACKAMENNSHVLLEKPIAGCISDVNDIINTRNKTGKKILIGYQLCYDETIRKVKEIILSGEFGKLQHMKCIVLWLRNAAYFNRNNWAGKISDSNGRLINDSVANNATAHFFMNLLYLAGKDMESAASIKRMDARLYRANPIETFDTCAIKAQLHDNIEFLALTSHATFETQQPKYKLQFENGHIECKDNIWRTYKDNKETIIGVSDHQSYKKIWDMLRFIDDDNYSINCTLECALEHTKMVEELSLLPVCEFKNNVKIHNDDYSYVEDLDIILNRAYDDFKLPII